MIERVWEGRYIAVEKQGNWEYAVRNRGIEAAVIVAVGRSFAPFTQGGRSWPRPEAFEGEIDVTGYALPGGDSKVQLATLFAKLPVAVLKVKAAAGTKQVRKRARAHS